MTEPDLAAAGRLDLSAIDPAGPGLVAGVARGGELTSVAMSGRETAAGLRLTEDTVFYTASLAKQVTAACLGILEAAGALRMNDSIRRHVRGLPQGFEPVTLAHLVHHTSGVAAPRGLEPYAPGAWWLRAGPADALAELVRTARFDTPPGAAYRYANEGYWLLAAAIEEASAHTLAQLAEWRLFAPLGMSRSRFRDRPEVARPGLAIGHATGGEGPQPIHTGFHVVGDGGFLTTLRDLARWDLFWSGRSVLGPDLPLRLTRPGVLNDGAILQYAWGVSLRRHRHKPIISHGGDFLGYRAKFVRFPAEDFAVLVLANSYAIDADGYALRLADLVLENQLDRTAPTWAETLRADARADTPWP